jgi:hypothetical protein
MLAPDRKQGYIESDCPTRLRLAKSNLFDRSVLGEGPLMVYNFPPFRRLFININRNVVLH